MSANEGAEGRRGALPALIPWTKAPLLVLLAALFISEVVLRATGFTQIPLYRSDARYEYMLAPDQDLERHGMRFITNEMGMRSGPIGRRKKRRALVTGDSVINGGGTVTQDSLATTIAERRTGTQVLNCSAPSWGAGNAAAFIAAHGTFEADAIIAVFSGHDAFDHMTFGPVVGHHPSYPDHRPRSAMEALVEKLWYRLGDHAPRTKERMFDPGWARLRDLAHQAGVPVIVVLHPQLDEVIAGHYDDRGRTLLDTLAAWKVPVVTMLDRMTPEMYLDAIHVNNAGQRAIATALEQTVGAH